jgi:hypothetical protein
VPELSTYKFVNYALSAPVDDCVHHNLDGVLVSEQVDDVKRVLHNAHLSTTKAAGTHDDMSYQHQCWGHNCGAERQVGMHLRCHEHFAPATCMDQN